MIKQILVVCAGNICRSPMAAGLFLHKLRGSTFPVLISSAGISALSGRPPEPLAISLMKTRGIDVSSRRARQLTPVMIQNVDLILVMEQWHIQAVERMLISARGKVHLLGKWRRLEMADPFQQPHHAYESSLKNISLGVEDWLARIKEITE